MRLIGGEIRTVPLPDPVSCSRVALSWQDRLHNSTYSCSYLLSVSTLFLQINQTLTRRRFHISSSLETRSRTRSQVKCRHTGQLSKRDSYAITHTFPSLALGQPSTSNTCASPSSQFPDSHFPQGMSTADPSPRPVDHDMLLSSLYQDLVVCGKGYCRGASSSLTRWHGLAGGMCFGT